MHIFQNTAFVLSVTDDSRADKEVVEHLEGVISVVVAGGQFQGTSASTAGWHKKPPSTIAIT